MTAKAAFFDRKTHGLVRVACATPKVVLANPKANAAAHQKLAQQAHEAGVDWLLFPELSLTGYSCDDLFTQSALLEAAEAALLDLCEGTKNLKTLMIVGVPIRHGTGVYNGAAVIFGGQILGLVPKTFLPNYREFYDKRYFASGLLGEDAPLSLGGQSVPFGTDLLFQSENHRFGIEICEDVWAPETPSTRLAQGGAGLIFNLSASPVTIGKNRARQRLCAATSERLMCAYVYSAAGQGESTTDLSWDGQSLIYELGNLLAEGERFRSDTLTIADIDMERIDNDRLKNGTFRDSGIAQLRIIETGQTLQSGHDLKRPIATFPYVPDDLSRRDEDCYEAFNIQVHGLMQRLESTGTQSVVIGISGGLDSTHALLVTTKAFDRLGLPRAQIYGYTMPGFGTSTGSRNDALKLMKALGVTGEILDIRPAAKRMLLDIGHPYGRGEAVYDINFENVQAGLRTDFLFRLAGEKKGFVIGTGDLSELALGWCTYGVGDHMSHYNVNCGAPKTLIQHLIGWAAKSEFDEKTAKVLRSVLDRDISPELIPQGANGDIQRTEDKVGPYELVDFFLYYITRYGMKPSKVLFLAHHAWGHKYEISVLKKWLEVFIWRFFTVSQFKRSAVPNGPKMVAGGSLSPRGDWRAPSDAKAAMWLEELRDVDIPPTSGLSIADYGAPSPEKWQVPMVCPSCDIELS